MSESRQDLLNWINTLLQLQITKIEELGKGDIFCQIFDSIFLDVPLKKVKFNAKHEFEYINNFKVLQTVFDKHKIPNQINVEKLVKLKFQDNFEFCQFAKKFWDTYFPCHAYDAVGRRSGQIPNANSHPSKSSSSSSSSSSSHMSHSSSFSSSLMLPLSSSSSTHNATKVKTSQSNHHLITSVTDPSTLQRALHQNDLLQLQLHEAQASLVTMEKERDFYYTKLRQVEVLLQQAQEQQLAVFSIDKILSILYATEDGFSNTATTTTSLVTEDPPSSMATLTSMKPTEPSFLVPTTTHPTSMGSLDGSHPYVNTHPMTTTSSNNVTHLSSQGIVGPASDHVAMAAGDMH